MSLEMHLCAHLTVEDKFLEAELLDQRAIVYKL